MKNRVRYCDALKFLSIILVIVIHIICDYRDIYVGNDQLKYAILTFLDSLTRIAVPIFFMITGSFMLSSKKKETYKEYLLKRIPKLLFPFLIISFIYYLVSLKFNNNPFNILVFINLFLMNNIKYHFWFMYTIIMIYILIPFIKTLVQNLNKKQLLNLITILFIFGNCTFFISTIISKFDSEFFIAFNYPDILIFINYLLVGYYLYNNKITSKNKKNIYISAIISLLLMNIVDNLYNTQTRVDVILTANSIFALLPAIAVYISFKENYDKLKIPESINNFITNNSKYIFYIYMLHVLVKEKIFYDYFKNIFIPNGFVQNILELILRVIVTTLVTYILSIIVEYIYEKIIVKIFSSIKKVLVK